jgi:hypothetical protein
MPRKEDLAHRVRSALYEELSPIFARLVVRVGAPARGGWKAWVEAPSKGASLAKLPELVPDLERRVARQFHLDSLKIDVKLDRDADRARELLAHFLRGWRVKDVSYHPGDPPDPCFGFVTIENPQIQGPVGYAEFVFTTDDEMLSLIEEASGYMPYGKQAREGDVKVWKA